MTDPIPLTLPASRKIQVHPEYIWKGRNDNAYSTLSLRFRAIMVTYNRAGPIYWQVSKAYLPRQWARISEAARSMTVPRWIAGSIFRIEIAQATEGVSTTTEYVSLVPGTNLSPKDLSAAPAIQELVPTLVDLTRTPLWRKYQAGS